MTTFCINRDENSTNYNFSIAPDGALSESITIRWEIVPIGALPITLPTPLSGEVTLTTTDTSKAVIPAISTSGTHGFPRDFEVRLYKVVEHAEDELLLTQAERLGGDASLVGDTRSYCGAQDKNIIGLGTTNNVTAAAGAANDTYIITRFQYGDARILDGLGDNNLIKFDYGVTITGYQQNGSLAIHPVTGAVLFERVGDIVLTLSTGAEITIINPKGNFGFQLGDSKAVLDYDAFRQTVGVSATEFNTKITFAEAEQYEVTTFVDAPVLSNPRTEEDVSLNVIGGGNEDILSVASDYNLTMNGAVNSDTYIISRFQYGDVTVQDTGRGETNLIKFDYGVEITDYNENALRFFPLL